MSHRTFRSSIAALAASLFIAPVSWADLQPYSTDFESADIGGTFVGDGWLFFNNVFDSAVFQFGYGGDAPNGPQISAIASGEGGVPQGNQQLNVYSDYDCCAGGFGHQGANGTVETNVFQEQTIGAADIGTTVEFSFEYKRGNIELSTTALAFIKTLDPGAGFATTNFVFVDLTSISPDWAGDSLSLLIDAGLEGQILQFGFSTTAGGFEGAGIFYDNIALTGPAPAAISFSEDFEGLDAMGTLLGNGWKFFNNVFESSVFQFGYGGDAPNGPQISAIAVGEGGPAQGDQQLNMYSDYDCCAGGFGHQGGPDGLVETNVFQERTIAAADIGNTFEFSFEVKGGNIEGASTALAFIKTLDPMAGFATTNFVFVDTTSVGSEWTGDTMSLSLADPLLEGQLLQFGFSTSASNFEGSGNFYDNVVGVSQAAVDTDGDGVNDDVDNCTTFPNPAQDDTNGDGYGNECDADINDDCAVNFVDLGLMKAGFFPSYDVNADLIFDGSVNFLDLGRLKQTFFSTPTPGPGPSPADPCVP